MSGNTTMPFTWVILRGIAHIADDRTGPALRFALCGKYLRDPSAVAVRPTRLCRACRDKARGQ